MQYTTTNKMYLLFLFKLHHKNGTSYFFIYFVIPFVGGIIIVYSVKYLKLEDTLLTHLIAYSIQKKNYMHSERQPQRDGIMNYSKHDAFLSFQDNILCFCFTTTTIETCTTEFWRFAKTQFNNKNKRLLKLPVGETFCR